MHVDKLDNNYRYKCTYTYATVRLYGFKLTYMYAHNVHTNQCYSILSLSLVPYGGGMSVHPSNHPGYQPNQTPVMVPPEMKNMHPNMYGSPGYMIHTCTCTYSIVVYMCIVWFTCTYTVTAFLYFSSFLSSVLPDHGTTKSTQILEII